ncbi:phage tail tape measure protein [Sphingobacterium lactis]|uniref:Phage tail tape measure protein, TP901 family, core region n=1 Tax=Sphingobacterium lactis TaxID=797291 RepID=A0A1H6BQM6_9SPHI|nr:phage tail tape measure protein [Sphingobacterium lactis]SEG63008.1 phage tail tape measure protein, TP901 family, core region [Sphingobacterium lactis]
MAKKLKSETLALDVIVNANQAQKEINDLARDITDATFRIKELKEEQALLAKEGKKDSEAYRELSGEIRTNRDRVKELTAQQDRLIKNLSLEQKTTSQLTRELTDLRRLRANSIPGSEQYKQYSKQIEIVTSRLSELREGAERTGQSVDSLSNRFKGWVASAAATAASLAAVTMGVRKAITEYASFDDLLADVMKTTNLSKESARELNEELKEIETRTSQEDLLGLSRIAGKLGYNEISEITEFVRANNQIIVSLNEDLGGNVEETVNKIGKLVDIFKLKDIYSTEDAFLKVGSALNELGMASTANEGYMVEFARRMAGVAPLAKVSIDQILGLGAALDQLGQTEEVSSTALSKLFVKMASNAETYSKYAGMQVKDFQQLLEKDFMGAFTKVLSGVKDNSNGINELASTLGDLGEDGGRVIGVLGSLANNVDVLKGSMQLANQAMEDGSSITQEYEIKNQSAGAKLAMAQKQVKNLWIELGEKLWPVMTQGFGIFGTFIKLLSSTITFISDNFRVISSLTVAIIAYYTAVQIAAKWEAITTGLMAVKRVAALSLNLIMAVLTGNITRAAAAQQLLNIRMLANPYGLVAAAILGLTAYLIQYSSKLSDAERAQKAVTDATLEGKKAVAGEKASIEQSISVAMDRAQADGVRLAAVKRLRDIMPNVLKDYTDEQIMAGKAKQAIDEYTKSLVKQATIRASRGKLEKLAQAKLEEEDRKERGFSGATIKERMEAMSPETFLSNDWRKAYEKHVDNNIKTIETEELKLASFIGNMEASMLNAVKGEKPDPTKDPVTVSTASGGDSKKAESSRKKAFQKELQEAEQYYQESLKKEGLFRKDKRLMTTEELEKMAAIESDYQQKVDQIHSKYNQTLKDTTKSAEKELNSRLLAESKAIDAILLKKQSEAEAEVAAYQERLAKAGLFGVQREEMTARQLRALEILEAEHKANLAKIDASAIAKEIDTRIAANKDIVTDLRIKHMEELTAIRTLGQAKQYLSKDLTSQELAQVKTLAQAKKLIQNQQMLEEQALLRSQLTKLADVLQRAQTSGEFDGLVLSDKILSEEEKKVLLDRIREIREQLAGLTGTEKKDDLDNSDREKVDILGMTIGQWETLFSNVDTTIEKIKQVISILGAAGQVWSSYNSLVSAKENAQLQQDERANNQKKENLKRRLDSGVISQEEYNKQVEKLDKDLDRKKAIVARDQAKRDRNVALMTAIVNTAKGITSAFPNPFLMALIAAVGALQIGTIVATPLPEIPGAETGGNFLDVIRAQDGKKFRAKSDPNKRGFISSPTVLVGEKGKEWVANNDAVENPHIKPILDVLDTAQRNGSISTMTLSDIIGNTLGNRIQGRQIGGSISGSVSPSDRSTGGNTSLENLLQQNLLAINELKAALPNIRATVTLLGKEGFVEKMAELNTIQNNGNF